MRSKAWIGALVLVTGCKSATDMTEQGNDKGTENTDDNNDQSCDTAGLSLPDGFCATVFADNLGKARHMAVTPSGDVFVAVDSPMAADGQGHVMALRDADGDGVAEVVDQVLSVGGNGIAYADGHLFVAPNDRVLRYDLADGSLVPERPIELVHDLPATPDHYAKTVVVVGDDMFVNIGSPSNACQVENRVPHSPGVDPCTELETRAGIWKFSASKQEQCMDTAGEHLATGMRNTNAMAYDAQSKQLLGAINGRDQLHDNWPELFTLEQELLLPAEEVVAIHAGDDYGWPYCYYDDVKLQKVLAPEYGGDGTAIGRCADKDLPIATLPAHWAPLSMVPYRGKAFGEHFQNGVFIANHGSRFDSQAMFDPGYNVVFLPFAEDQLQNKWEEFAGGFAGDALPLPDAAVYRPVGLAVMPDGSLLISDDKVGRIWKVTAKAAGGGDDDGGCDDDNGHDH